MNEAVGMGGPGSSAIVKQMRRYISGKTEIVVGVAEHFTAAPPQTFKCIGLGSCIGIAIFDPRTGLGGLAHAMLPRFDDGKDKNNASKYADSCIYVMVDELLEMGANQSTMRAKIAGGAQMFQFLSNDTLNIGLRNSEVAKETLRKERIPLIAEDLGGNEGRTVHFDPSTGSYTIQKGGRTVFI